MTPTYCLVPRPRLEFKETRLCCSVWSDGIMGKLRTMLSWNSVEWHGAEWLLKHRAGAQTAERHQKLNSEEAYGKQTPVALQTREEAIFSWMSDLMSSRRRKQTHAGPLQTPLRTSNRKQVTPDSSSFTRNHVWINTFENLAKHEPDF